MIVSRTLAFCLILFSFMLISMRCNYYFSTWRLSISLKEHFSHNFDPHKDKYILKHFVWIHRIILLQWISIHWNFAYFIVWESLLSIAMAELKDDLTSDRTHVSSVKNIVFIMWCLLKLNLYCCWPVCKKSVVIHSGWFSHAICGWVKCQ